MQSTLPKHQVVLLGIGHTNAHILRMWRMSPILGAGLTCVSNYPLATYSGMLPGVLAGQYRPEAMEIDLVRLCAAAGARLIVGQVTGLDRGQRALLFADRPPLPFDVLSIGIGSVPTREGLEATDDTLLPIKPMQTFLERLEQRLEAWAGARGSVSESQGEPLRIVVAGGGVGGVEIAFCLPRRIERVLGSGAPYKIAIVESGEEIGGGLNPLAAGEVAKLLAARHVKLVTGRRVTQIAGGQAWLDDGDFLPADIVLWATSAAAPPVLDRLDLPKDERGFLLTAPTLECSGTPGVFAVGDTGTIRGTKLPKAGVYAVREGPVLWENIQHAVRGEKLVEYQPQRRFLKLLNTGDGNAIGEYAGHTFRGRLMWWLKDRIDTRFMAMYQDYAPREMTDDNGEPQERRMRCAGCGGKVGGSVLSRALARLDVPLHERVVVGLAEPDDAAVIAAPSGGQMAVTTDFFAAPLDDPYLVGRMAALHAASDVLVKGAKPIAALAMATIPPGAERQQEQLLYELLSGGLRELQAMGATLAGGHTIEGPQLTIGYTILAEQPRTLRAKGGLQPGDVLVLTRPLGTGVLLAAQMQARLKAPWYEPLVAAMLRSNQPAAELLDAFDVSAATDVTGFGLAGHLLEMLRASKVAAEIDLDAIPLLPGAAELLTAGLESTLAPANRAAEDEIEVAEPNRDTPAYRALFDPQTCGGLLVGVAQQQAAELVRKFVETGETEARAIGFVAPFQDERRVRIRRASGG